MGEQSPLFPPRINPRITHICRAPPVHQASPGSEGSTTAHRPRSLSSGTEGCLWCQGACACLSAVEGVGSSCLGGKGTSFRVGRPRTKVKPCHRLQGWVTFINSYGLHFLFNPGRVASLPWPVALRAPCVNGHSLSVLHRSWRAVC